MFALSKLLWFLLRPSSLLLIALCAGVVVMRRREPLGRRMVVASAALFVLASFVPLWAWLTDPLEQRFPRPDPMPDNVAGVVILGGAVEAEVSQVHGRPALVGAAERVVAMGDLGRRYPFARLLYTGGSGSLRTPGLRGAHHVPELARQLGLRPSRVELEAEARNTYENAKRALEVAEPAPGEIWLLVTSASHMPRAVGCFREVGFKVLPYPVDYTVGTYGERLHFDLSFNLSRLDGAAREWLGLLGYYLMGRTDDLLPGP